MREIKFRAWDKVEKRYWTQDEMNNIGGFYYIFGVSPDEDEFDLQQYTGLKDKNGKEIYEGDILKLGKEFITKVEYKDSGFVFNPKENPAWHRHAICLVKKEDREVIGNIYETPSLLKES